MKTPWCLLSVFLATAVVNVATAEDSLTLGFHAHNPNHIEAAARAGYAAIRLWDTGTDWSSIKPQREQWNFERIDAYLAASEKAHLKILWTLGSTPRWASARPNERCAYGLGCAAEPANIEDWRRYVRTVATTFRGRIECYEPWNEVSFPSDPIFRLPGTGGDPSQFFSGSVEAMVNLTRVAYEEIKQVDPQACVLSPSFHSSGNWAEKLDRFLAAGGGRYFDVVSQHFYFGEEPERIVPTIRAMKQVLAKHKLSHLPIWNSETGWPFLEQRPKWPKLSLEELVYAVTLRTYLLNRSEGVSRIYWYAWDNKGMGFFDTGTNIDFGSAAASAAIHLLDGVESASCEVNGLLWQCHVATRQKRFKVLWLSGNNVEPVLVTFKDKGIRWGRRPEVLPAGQKIALDGRPVIVEENY
ncbi:hypothetical protein [Dechloromonas sp. HYN0024]|uniref:hypothetical protein n=1 Tax=Dechloromonas sp. HYN0024 TaxID=2231055 RepID=UPI000E4471D1|nr:hypothetical protein [Dechloromonas sp. HYN0024]AXS80114.1 hypothetical protein HYN24_08835 [Dechloromonas sp. HYN0024]